MPLHVVYADEPEKALSASVLRLADGFQHDFADGVFRADPADPLELLAEDAAPFRGRYRLTITPTPAEDWPDGDYVVTIHDDGVAVDNLAVAMLRGDDAIHPDPLAQSAAVAYAADSFGRMFRNWDGLGVALHVADVSPSAAGFRVAVLSPPAPEGAFVGQSAVFRAGVLEGLRRPIVGYVASTRRLVVDPPFPAAPTDGDELQVY